MDNEQERNEHFKGFAQLLWEDVRRNVDFYADTSEDHFDEHIVQIIAQRAYDLVYHALNTPGMIGFFTGKSKTTMFGEMQPEVLHDADKTIKHIQDLTEWPKTPSTTSAPDE